ncbi:VanZ family protein [Novosphingobium soli]|uniref:VanZ family protein n=1 Tax=Novosphingobium soli TaxID=574956 RepID=A0ABV6D289_9SPHN
MQNVLRIAFWLALVFAVVMAIMPHPPAFPGEPSDKIQHMLAFATLAVLGAFAYPRVPKLAIAAALVAVGAAIEVVQMIPVLHRDAELMDLVADSFAILVVLGVTSLALTAARRR